MKIYSNCCEFWQQLSIKTSTITKFTGKAKDAIHSLVKQYFSEFLVGQPHKSSPIATPTPIAHIPKLVVHSPYNITIEHISPRVPTKVNSSLMACKSDVMPHAMNAPIIQPIVHGFEYETVSDASFLEMEAYCSRPSDEFNAPIASSTIIQGNIDNHNTAQRTSIKVSDTMYSQQSTAIADGPNVDASTISFQPDVAQHFLQVPPLTLGKSSDSDILASSSPAAETHSISPTLAAFNSLSIDEEAKTKDQQETAMPLILGRDEFDDSLEFIDYILAHAQRLSHGKFENQLSDGRRNALTNIFCAATD